MVHNNLVANVRWLESEEGRASKLLGMTPLRRAPAGARNKNGFSVWVVSSDEDKKQRDKVLKKLGKRGLEGLLSFQTPQAQRIPLRELNDTKSVSAPNGRQAPPAAPPLPLIAPPPTGPVVPVTIVPARVHQQPAMKNKEDNLYDDDWDEDVLRECLEVTDEVERAIAAQPPVPSIPARPSLLTRAPLPPSMATSPPLEIRMADIRNLVNTRDAVLVEDLERLIAAARTLYNAPSIVQPLAETNTTGPQCLCPSQALRRTSNTAENPGRVFFTCAEKVCDYFEWEDAQNHTAEPLTGHQCLCAREAVRRTSNTAENPGRVFFTCAEKACEYFEWEDQDSAAVYDNQNQFQQTTTTVPNANGMLDFQYANSVTFGHKGFRPGQREVVEAALTGRDCFVLMPTGGGKSLCYQLPAWCCPGLAVVFSPLVSLIQDQVDSMNECGVHSATLSSSSAGGLATDATWAEIKSLPAHGGVKLLYITPEKFSQSNQTRRILHELANKGLVSRFIVDEAHCVSSWGHDFRPDYLQLQILRKEFQQVPIMALTATADRRVVDDVSNVLGLRQPYSWRSSFNRAKLDYEVRTKNASKAKSFNEIAEYVKYHINESGLVYCLSRRDCETLCESLRKALPGSGHRISFYHGEVHPTDREDRQRRWSRGELKLMCATLAFGMGVNKPDVRYVIHYSVPKSLANYYQESGRCGRDGLGGKCILYFGAKDRAIQEAMIRDDFGDGEAGKRSRDGIARNSYVISTELDALKQMGLYALDSVRCRRAIVLEYFGEHDFDPVVGCGGLCDNCRDRRPHEDRNYGDHVRNLVQLLQQLTDSKKINVTSRALADTYRGADNEASRKLKAAAQNSSFIGRGVGLKKQELDDLVLRLVLFNIFNERQVANKSGFSNSYIFIGDAASIYLDAQSGPSPPFLVKVRLSDSEARHNTNAIYPPRPRRDQAPSLSSEVSFSFDQSQSMAPPDRRHSAPLAKGANRGTEFEVALSRKQPPATCANDQRSFSRTKRTKVFTEEASSKQNGLDSRLNHAIALRQILSDWREKMSAQQSLLPYQIISESHMQTFASAFAKGPPRTVESLVDVVDAFPAVKVKKYGATIVDLITNYFSAVPGFEFGSEEDDDDEFAGMDDILLQSLSAHETTNIDHRAVTGPVLQHQNLCAIKRRRIVAGSSPSSIDEDSWDEDD